MRAQCQYRMLYSGSNIKDTDWVQCQEAPDTVEGFTAPLSSMYCRDHRLQMQAFIKKMKESKVYLPTTMTGPFSVHKMNENGIKKANDIREIFEDVFTDILYAARQTKPGPLSTADPAGLRVDSNRDELTHCLKALQEASFWAKRAVSILPENQE